MQLDLESIKLTQYKTLNNYINKINKTTETDI